MRHDKIADYYNQTEFDYRVAWYAKDNPALHFGLYDKHRADNHYEALSHTNTVLAEAVSITANDHVLDAGCGLGSSAMWINKHLGARVTGISITERQIQQCQKNATQLGLSDQLNFYQADYCNTPFADDSFDVVWACESVCHAEHKLDFYREAYRLLKPGGRLVMAEYIRAARPLAAEDELLLRAKWLKNWMISDLDTGAEHQKHLRAANFQQIKLKNVNSMVDVSLRNLHEKCTRSYPIEVVLKWLGIRSSVQHGNLVGSINQYQAFQKELWWYAIITAEKGK